MPTVFKNPARYEAFAAAIAAALRSGMPRLSEKTRRDFSGVIFSSTAPQPGFNVTLRTSFAVNTSHIGYSLEMSTLDRKVLVPQAKTR